MEFSTNSKSIISIYKSRMTILDFLHNIGFDISTYQSFNMNEIDSMSANTQLDMLVTHKTLPKKIYVKYYISTPKSIRPQVLDEIVEDLFTIENVLNKETDTLILITNDDPNDSIINKIKYLYDRDGIFIVIHNIKRLQFNLLEHEMIPKVSILNEEETREFTIKYDIKDILLQVPEISRFDPLSLAICMRPRQICKLIRNSTTALESIGFRVCV